MSNGSRRHLTYSNVMSTFAVFLGLAGGAYAVSGIPDSHGLLHGCVSNSTGVLRIVKSANSCGRATGHGKRRNPGEFAVTWNEKGRTGATGVNGVNGINGANGVDGAAGTNSATNIVVRRGSPIEVSGFSFDEAKCNPGERATGGGGTVEGGSGEGKLVSSYPVPQTPGTTPTGWVIQETNGTTLNTVTVTAYVVCVSP